MKRISKRTLRPGTVACAMLKLWLSGKGLTIVDLADRLGYKRGHFYNVLHGANQSAKVIAKIEKFIGLPLWTDPQRKVEIKTSGSLKICVAAIDAVMMESGMSILQESNAQTLPEMMAVLAPPTNFIPQGAPSTIEATSPAEA